MKLKTSIILCSIIAATTMPAVADSAFDLYAGVSVGVGAQTLFGDGKNETNTSQSFGAMFGLDIPVFRAELVKTKEHLQSKPRIKGVSGVVIADKITEMKYSDKIHGDITPTLGKRLREKITKEMMMQLKQS